MKFEHFPVRTVGSLFGPDLTSFHLPPAAALRLDLLGSSLAQGFAIAVLVAVESLEAMELATDLTGERFRVLSSSVSRRVLQSLSLANESPIFLASAHKSSPIQSHGQG